MDTSKLWKRRCRFEYGEMVHSKLSRFESVILILIDSLMSGLIYQGITTLSRRLVGYP